MAKLTKFFNQMNQNGEKSLRIQVEDTVLRKNTSAIGLLNKGDSRFSGNVRKGFSIISLESLEDLSFDNGKKLTAEQISKIKDFAEKGELGLENGLDVELKDIKVEELYLRVQVKESLSPFNEWQAENIQRSIKKIQKSESVMKSSVLRHESVAAAAEGEWCVFAVRVGSETGVIFQTNNLIVATDLEEPVQHTFIEDVLAEMGVTEKPVLFAESFFEEQGIDYADLVIGEMEFSASDEIASEKKEQEKAPATKAKTEKVEAI